MNGEAWQEVGAQIEAGIMADLSEQQLVVDWMSQIGGAFYPNGMIVLLRSSAFASPMQFDALPEAAAWIRSIGWEAQS